MVTSLERIAATAAEAEAWSRAKSDLEHPSHMAPGPMASAQVSLPPASPAAASAPPTVSDEPGGPARAFLHWLDVLVRGKGDVLGGAKSLLEALEQAQSGAESTTNEQGPSQVTAEQAHAFARDLPTMMLRLFTENQLDLPWFVSGLRQAIEYVEKNYADAMKAVRANLQAPLGNRGAQPLGMLMLYELLRQAAPAALKDGPAIIRSEEDEHRRAKGRGAYDPSPVNYAFTFAGLGALRIDAATLSSFPDAFQQGMAARADVLHDTGQSAPKHWDGELGLPSIHGYFNGGFSLAEDEPPESFWKELRADIRAFNKPDDERGQQLRFILGFMFRSVGLEVVHVELGQDPYDVDESTGRTVPLPSRQEHFGFVDGVSQPFLDMGLGDPPAGGGTPARNGSWAPVAPGEIVLSEPDEDGDVHRLPISADLRRGSTFLIFRKLEQDVFAFRTYLAQQCPGDRAAQQSLAAQFVGRWQNGTPLVLSPDAPRAPQDDPAGLNDFRYAADDPNGSKCPLGAHVRRANPRDLGGLNDVSRHRILRLGISYGGPRLADAVPSDGEPRGLLFVAANARIDLQFELIQSRWINGGEILGQAGLGRCPLTGAHSGKIQDSFLPVNASSPVTQLPRFVITRGGDYFFAPGVRAMQAIASGTGRFQASQSDLPFGRYSMGDARTEPLFDTGRLNVLAGEILNPQGPRLKSVSLPDACDVGPKTVVFLGRYDDVKLALSGEGDGEAFSVQPFRDLARRVTEGGDLIVATDTTGPTASAHHRLTTLADRAWSAIEEQPGGALERSIRAMVREVLTAGLRRTATTRHVDLLKDLAVPAAFAVVVDLFGVAGPPASPGQPDDALAALQTQSVILLADLMGNLESIQPLRSIADEAGTAMLGQIQSALASARLQEPKQTDARPRTLVDAFVRLENDKGIKELYRSHLAEDRPSIYYRDASLILLEFVGAVMAIIPMTLSKVMEYLLDQRMDLSVLAPQLDEDGLARLICEAERLNPCLPARMRRCERDFTLPGSEGTPATIKKNYFVAAMVQAANMDGSAFDNPSLFSLSLPGDPKRALENYLLFGPQQRSADGKRIEGMAKSCWGKDRVALPVLKECLRAMARLKGLRRVAGQAGVIATQVEVPVGFPARFTSLLPG